MSQLEDFFNTMQFYVRARPVRKGVDFLSKLGSDLDERMQFPLMGPF